MDAPKYYYVTARGDSGYAYSKETLRKFVELYGNPPYSLEINVYKLTGAFS